MLTGAQFAPTRLWYCIWRIFCEVKMYSLLKRKYHFDEIFVTDITGSCHIDDFRFSRWRKFRQMITYPFQWFKNILLNLTSAWCRHLGSGRRGGFISCRVNMRSWLTRVFVPLFILDTWNCLINAGKTFSCAITWRPRGVWSTDEGFFLHTNLKLLVITCRWGKKWKTYLSLYQFSFIILKLFINTLGPGLYTTTYTFS